MAAPEFVPAEPIINLHPSVVERLSREVWLAFESTPPQGMEIGGFLLGEADSQAHFVEIQDFDALQCEDRPDHRFVHSDSERRALEKTLAARGSTHDGKLKVVGCYRSQIDEGLTLSEESLSFARACLGDTSGVFLLIKYASNRDLSAGFFFWGSGQVDSAYTFQEFPFDTRRLAAALVSEIVAGVEFHSPSPGAPSHPEIADRIDELSPADSTPSAARFEPPTFIAAPPAEAGKPVDEPVRVKAPPPAPPAVFRDRPAEPEEERHPIQALLGQARALAGRVRPFFEQASSALVSRASAWREHRFHLQWRPLVAVLAVVLSVSGYRAYRNRTPGSVAADAAALAFQVDWRENDLRVSWNRDAQAVSHARKGVLLIRDGDSPPRELPLDLDQLRNGWVIYSPISTSVQFRLEVTEPDNTKRTETVFALAARRNLTQGLAKKYRQLDAASARDRKQLAHPAPPASKRDLPADVAQANGPAKSRSAPSRPAALPSKRVVQQPAPDAPAAAARSSATTQASGAAPGKVEQAASAAAFVAARAIGETRPYLTASVRSTVTSAVEVQVKVRIDESGRVVRADPVALAGPASSSLVNATESAARLWKFAPAMRGNQPIASEVVLKFSYRPAR